MKKNRIRTDEKREEVSNPVLTLPPSGRAASQHATSRFFRGPLYECPSIGFYNNKSGHLELYL